MDEQVQHSASGSNKMWYIIGAIVVVLLLGWFFSRGAWFLGSAASGVDVDRDLDGSTTYSNDEGSVTVGSTSYPDNWPSDVPRYGNGTIQFSGNSNPQTGASGAAVMFQTTDNAQVVIDFYKTELTKNGWTIEGTVSANGALVLSAKKDTRTFGAYAVPSGDGKVSVTAGVEL